MRRKRHRRSQKAVGVLERVEADAREVRLGSRARDPGRAEQPEAEVGTAVRIAGKRTDSGHEGMI
jgi:hypothetical protein